MKKLLILTLIIVAVAWLYNVNKPENDEVKVDTGASTSRPDPSNATFFIEDEEVTLSNGINAGTELTNLLEYGDINTDGKNDTALVLLRSAGASGVFIYVSAYVSGPVSYKGTNAVLVGDRVDPQSLSVNNGVITLLYLDRLPEEPMAAEPTVRHTMELVYRNGELVVR